MYVKEQGCERGAAATSRTAGWSPAWGRAVRYTLIEMCREIRYPLAVFRIVSQRYGFGSRWRKRKEPFRLISYYAKRHKSANISVIIIQIKKFKLYHMGWIKPKKSSRATVPLISEQCWKNSTCFLMRGDGKDSYLDQSYHFNPRKTSFITGTVPLTTALESYIFFLLFSECRMKRKSVASKINKMLDDNESLIAKICDKASSIK